VDDIVFKALEHERDKRYQSAAEMKTDIETEQGQEKEQIILPPRKIKLPVPSLVAMVLSILMLFVFLGIRSYYPKFYQEYKNLDIKALMYDHVNVQTQYRKKELEPQTEITIPEDSNSLEYLKYEIAKQKVEFWRQVQEKSAEITYQAIHDRDTWIKNHWRIASIYFIMIPLIVYFIMAGCGFYSLKFLKKVRNQTGKSGVYLCLITILLFLLVAPFGFYQLLQLRAFVTDRIVLFASLVLLIHAVLIVSLFSVFLRRILAATRNQQNQQLNSSRAYVSLEIVIFSFVIAFLANYFCTHGSDKIYRNSYYLLENYREQFFETVMPLAFRNFNSFIVKKENTINEEYQKNIALKADKISLLISEQDKISNLKDSIFPPSEKNGTLYNTLYKEESMGILSFFLFQILGFLGVGMAIHYLTTKPTQGRVVAWIATMFYPVIIIGIGMIMFFHWLSRLNGQTAIAVAIIILALFMLIIGTILIYLLLRKK